MPRYFYLLCLLLAINWVFCYDYISDHNPQITHGRQPSKKVRGQKSRRDKEYIAKKNQELEVVGDKDPVAQIDVASFIQKPDEYPIDEIGPYELDNSRRKTKLKHANDYGSLSDYSSDEYIMKQSNKRPYYSNPDPDNSFDLGPNPLLLKDTINSRHLNLDSLSLHGLNNVKRNSENKLFSGNYEDGSHDANTNRIHNPEKKSVLKYMKFPFFSHNKTGSSKPIKEKKRKVFCFNCPKKKNKPNHLADNDIFKESAKKEKLESPSKIAITAHGDNFDNLRTKIKRGKRDYWTEANDRQRQLKELDEIQKKVDSVEIAPVYQKHQ